MTEEKVGPTKSKKLIKKEKKKQKDKIVPFVGTNENMSPEEQLDFENRAYDMIHRATTEYACLSCDFLTNNLSVNKAFKRQENVATDVVYPADLYGVAGSQATLPSRNQLYVLRFSNLCQTKYDDDSDDADETEEISEGNPIIITRSVPVKGGINRIRSMMGSPIVALWTETQYVKIYNIEEAYNQLREIDISKYETSKGRGVVPEDQCLISNFKLSNEGFALEWSPVKVGRLLSGTVDGKVNLFDAEDELCGKFIKADHFYSHHQGSVEDIQFSPTQEDVFASCSTDGTVQLIDMREKNNYKKSAIKIQAHDCDVNVISWNSKMANLIASGADDGSVKVWDLRYVTEPAITNVKWHQSAITSIQWQPHDEWTLAASSADNRVSIWDFSVENNEQEIQETEVNIPEQIIFLHHGQEDIKEVRWHPVLKNVLMTTAHSGFNIIKPAINEDAPSEINSEEENELEIIPTLN